MIHDLKEPARPEKPRHRPSGPIRAMGMQMEHPKNIVKGKICLPKSRLRL